MIVHPSEDKKGDHDCGALDCGRLRGRGLGRLRRSTTGLFAPISNRVGPELGSDGRVSASPVRRHTARGSISGRMFVPSSSMMAIRTLAFSRVAFRTFLPFSSCCQSKSL